MENTLRHLRALYPDAFRDAPSAPPAQTPLLDTDEAVRAEAEALAEAKFYLDLRAPSRPDAAVLDAVMDAAAFASVAPQPGRARKARADRPALVRRSRRVRRASVVLATAFSVVLSMGVVLRPAAPDTPPASSTAEVAPADPVQAPRVFMPQSIAATAETIAPVQVEAVASRPAPPPTDWRTTDDAAQDIHRDLDRLEMLAASLTADLDLADPVADNSDLAALFDTPATRLEAAPGAPRSIASAPSDGKGSYHAVLARRHK